MFLAKLVPVAVVRVAVLGRTVLRLSSSFSSRVDDDSRQGDLGAAPPPPLLLVQPSLPDKADQYNLSQKNVHFSTVARNVSVVTRG